MIQSKTTTEFYMISCKGCQKWRCFFSVC